MGNMSIKSILDELVARYETADFIKDDPIQFPHRYSKKEDVEIAAFLASLLAYGKRELFIKKLDFIFSFMDKGPYDFVLNFEAKENCLDNFVYRFVKDSDLKCLFRSLNKLYSEGSSLEHLFAGGTQKAADYFYDNADCSAGFGFYHLIPNPKKGGALKRFNMFLRWMARKGPVDLGIWTSLPPSELFIPLDVHVGNISRSLGLLKRSANDFKSVSELTEKLREFDAGDPIKYDFALFGAGIDKIALGRDR